MVKSLAAEMSRAVAAALALLLVAAGGAAYSNGRTLPP